MSILERELQREAQVPLVDQTDRVYPPLSASQVNTDLCRPVLQTNWRWWAVLGFFVTIFGVAFLTFCWQVYQGMGVWGMDRPVYWGLDIANFIFWAGVALSGTMISAILRLLHAGWRRSLTRLAETLTVCALAVAGIFPLLHIGRNWVFFWMLPYPNERQLWPDYKSPLVWDATALSVYLITSVIFWFSGIIPDFATLRERTFGWRRTLYTILALGWRGTDREWRRLKVLFGILTVMIIPVFVSLHTIVGWDFGMSIVPGWHSNIFAPYFVLGALLSGAGAVCVVMCLLRWAFHLEDYVLPQHFDNLGKILLAISLFWSYFFGGDIWSDWFSRDPDHENYVQFLFGGYKYMLVLLPIFAVGVPLIALLFKRVRRSPWAMLAIGVSVNIAMFTERILVVVPSVARNRLTWGSYTPAWPDVVITVGAYGLFGTLYTLLTKFIPIVSMWEFNEGAHAEGIEKVGGVEMPVTLREEAIG